MRVLSVIREREPIARVEIAEATGLTKPTVSAIVAEWIADGWVREAGTRPSGPAGRRPRPLEFVPGARLVLGVDVGITRVRVGLFDLSATLLARAEERLQAGHGALSPETLMETITQGAEQVLSGADRARLLGVGIGLHGLVDARTGVSLFAPHFGWRGVPFGEPLAERLGLPVTVENDVRAMALGESMFGSGRSAGTLVCINVGTGIGAGIVMQGVPYRGMHGGAGEIGHTKVDPAGRPCSCGGRGCLETIASGPAIVARAIMRVAAGERSALAGESISGQRIFRAARLGDRLALELLTEAGHYLGVALANLVNLLNPQVIAIGGGLSGAGRLLLDPLQEALCREALPGLTDGLIVTPVRHGANAGLVGAAALVLHPLFAEGSIHVRH